MREISPIVGKSAGYLNQRKVKRNYGEGKKPVYKHRTLHSALEVNCTSTVKFQQPTSRRCIF
jgi:hypothetical protein